jgi:hypothetical protein
MLIALGILLLVGWVALKLIVGVTSVAVHLLLAAAVIAVVAHFLRGGFSRRGTAST